MLNVNNADKKNKNFMYQNLQKSKCFNSNFSSSNFDYACFRGAHLKSCNFNECSFNGAEFIGANLKDSKFRGATFSNTVFEGAKLEGVDFKGAKFKNVIFAATSLEGALNLNLQDPEIKVYPQMPELTLNSDLKVILEKLMENPFVKRSRVLDTKDKKMNTISVMLLLERFGEETLLSALPKIDVFFDRDFYTLSYIEKSIEKVLKEELV